VNRLEREPGQFDAGARLPPQRLTHLEGQVELASASPEIEAGGLVLLALPAGAAAEIDPTPGQDVPSQIAPAQSS